MLNLFYEEPDGDRWLPLDRYARRLVRRILRGPRRVGGQERVFLNLCAGLQRIGVPFRVNDYRHLARHPDELACVVGKPFVLDKLPGRNSILFGASVFSHPVEDPDLLERLPVRRVLVPGEWMRRMWEPYYGERVSAWPVGIDTGRWAPRGNVAKDTDVLLYYKIRWKHEEMERELVAPVREGLRRRNLSCIEIRYGHYHESDFHRLLGRCRAMVFLCEHETQGIAYQQALAAGLPILAWDRGGPWQDPSFYPERVVYGPVSSVPYWDERCGLKFAAAADFPAQLDAFVAAMRSGSFAPRDYILGNLTLEAAARNYVGHCESAMGADAAP